MNKNSETSRLSMMAINDIIDSVQPGRHEENIVAPYVLSDGNLTAFREKSKEQKEAFLNGFYIVPKRLEAFFGLASCLPLVRRISFLEDKKHDFVSELKSFEKSCYATLSKDRIGLPYKCAYKEGFRAALSYFINHHLNSEQENFDVTGWHQGLESLKKSAAVLGKIFLNRR